MNLKVTSSPSLFFTLTQSSHDPSGFLVLYGCRRLTRSSQAFCTAAPLRSEEAEAAVGLVLGTVLVLVSEMWILEQGIHRTLLATWQRRRRLMVYVRGHLQ